MTARRNSHRQRRLAILAAILAATSVTAPAPAAELTGVNLAGAEFGGLAAAHGKGYIYPDAAQMRAFRAEGMNVFRVPVRWERLQPTLAGPLDEAEMARLDQVIATATALDAAVIIDIHNYARYARQTLGSAAVPLASFADLWRRLAARYKGNPRVIFGLMNEPVRISVGDWATAANLAIAGIRGTGAGNLVLVPGVYWSGAHSWLKRMTINPSNAVGMAAVRDPGANMAFDFHQYFDANSSGTGTACVAPDVAVARLAVATNWLRATGNRGMLTEFGVARAPECAPVLTAALRHLAVNPEWHGWTLWGSSAWFGDYPFSLYPFQSPPPPQLALVRPFLVGTPTTTRPD